jgi:hypothetical protein
MRSIFDNMTPEQRARYEAHVARHLAKPKALGVFCAFCDKLIAEVQSKDGPMKPSPKELMAAGAVPIPNFGWFCGHACVDAYERDFGIRFQRDATGKVSYYWNGLQEVEPVRASGRMKIARRFNGGKALFIETKSPQGTADRDLHRTKNNKELFFSSPRRASRGMGHPALTKTK